MLDTALPLQYIFSVAHSTQGLPNLCLQICFKNDSKTLRFIALPDLFQITEQLLATDQQLVYWLKLIYQQQVTHEYAANVLVLHGALGAQVLPLLLASKNCYWINLQNALLIEGPPCPAHLEWETTGDGLKKLKCHLIGRQNIIFKLDPFWYLDQRTGQCGIVTIDLAPNIVNKLLAAPAMTDRQIKALYAALGNRSFSKKLPTKKKLARSFVLLPELHLCMLPVLIDNPYEENKKISVKVPVVSLQFNYGGKSFAAYKKDDAGKSKIMRDTQAEQDALTFIQTQGLIPLAQSPFAPATHIGAQAYFTLLQDNASAWLDFNLKVLPIVRDMGWQVSTSSEYPYQVIDQGDVEWYTELEEVVEQKWFNMELGISIHGEKINLLPLIVRAIENFFIQQKNELNILPEEGHLITKLPDGRLLPIPIARLKPILNVLTELFDHYHFNDQGKIRLSRIRAAQLLALEQSAQNQLNMRWWSAAQLQSLAKHLQNFKSIEQVVAPKGLAAVLRPYQQEGLNWLQFLRHYDLGGILADDMGLGKTIQTLTHILCEKESGRMKLPCLVVTPTTLVMNWQCEAKKYCPDLNVLVLHGASRQELFKDIKHYDVILTTYPLIVRDHDFFEKNKFYLIVLDEAQIIKNARSKAAILINKLDALYRLCLTGTPLENHLGELWSLFNFVMPGLLGDRKQFTRLFRIPIEKQHQTERQLALQERITPFILRRTKKSVALDLPDKTEILSMIEFEETQGDLYESVRLSLHESVQQAVERRGFANSQIIILDALLKLRQICCDPKLLKLHSVASHDVPSAKLQYLCDVLPNMIEEGRKILLFSQFTEMLGLIEKELLRLNIPYVILTGQTQDRMQPINAFQNGAVPLFLISLKAGGLGLNLTAADVVIHYDPWWNPAVERQATDRAHRIGQDKSIFVYKLIMAGSIEEKILALQQKKQNLLELLQVDLHDGSKQLCVEDLQQILQAL